jgi:transcriptional regulator with XRE-family HTH domain
MNDPASLPAAGNIAANIRLLCEHHGSIAEVCRATGINRQQFNKYLSGRTLPHVITMRRLCDFFSVTEKQLFLDPAIFKQLVNGGNLVGSPCLSSRCNSLLHEMTKGAADCLPQGLYYAYFPWLRDSSKTLRALLAVRKRGDLLTFKRFTRITNSNPEISYCVKSKHDGLVFERQGTIFLAALDGRTQGGLSLMTFGRSAVGETGAFVGLALVLTAWGDPIASRVTLVSLPLNAKLWPSLNRCGVVDIHSNDIDSMTRETIVMPNTEAIPQLLAYSAMQRTHD